MVVFGREIPFSPSQGVAAMVAAIATTVNVPIISLLKI
jgi:hypothetical protein